MSRPGTDAARRRLAGLHGSPGGLLTAWLGSWLAGRASSDDLLDAVQVGDEPHRYVTMGDANALGDIEPATTPAPLAGILPAIRRLAPATVQLRLPIAGDVDGLHGLLLAGALQAGEAVLVEPLDARHAGLVLLPSHDVRGSELEPLVQVTWHAAPWHARCGLGPGAPTGLRDAERALAAAVNDAVCVLVDAGQVSRLGPQSQAAIRALRERQAMPLGLPPGSPADAVRVLTTAEKLAAVVELAVSNEPLSAAADAKRSTALRQVATAVRHARRHAYTACAGNPGGPAAG